MITWALDPYLRDPDPDPLLDAGWGRYLSFLPLPDSFLAILQEQIRIVDDPKKADRILVPALLNRTAVKDFAKSSIEMERFLNSSPLFRSGSSKHVLFMLGDDYRLPSCCDHATVFLPSCSKHSRARPICYFADPPARSWRPIDQCKVQVAFQGCVSTCPALRSEIVSQLESCDTHSVAVRLTDGYFHTTYDPARQIQMTEQYWDLMDATQFVACPRGNGMNSLRFFETLAIGRLPILIADDAALPLQDYIPYDDFVVTVPEQSVHLWERYLDRFLDEHPDLRVCSAIAKDMSEQWFRKETIARFVEASLMSQ